MLDPLHTLLHLRTQQVEALKLRNQRLQDENATLRAAVYTLATDLERTTSLLEDAADADDAADIAEAERLVGLLPKKLDDACPGCGTTEGPCWPDCTVEAYYRRTAPTQAENIDRVCRDVAKAVEQGTRVHPGSPGTLVDTAVVAHWRERALEAEAALQTIHGMTGRAGDDHGSTRALLACVVDGIASMQELLNDFRAQGEP